MRWKDILNTLPRLSNRKYDSRLHTIIYSLLAHVQNGSRMLYRTMRTNWSIYRCIGVGWQLAQEHALNIGHILYSMYWTFNAQ